jgi:hypothetical protein
MAHPGHRFRALGYGVRYAYVPGSIEAHDISVRPTPPAPPPAFRIIVPMRPLTDAEVTRTPGLQRLCDLLTVHTRTTYAMVEEIATATLIESVAMRFTLADGRAGAALWWDWYWHGGLLQGEGRLTREHLEALITGAPWPPPPVVCPRCLAEVRENADGSPRAHGKKRKCRGFWPSLMPCCYGKPVEGITR